MVRMGCISSCGAILGGILTNYVHTGSKTDGFNLPRDPFPPSRSTNKHLRESERTTLLRLSIWRVAYVLYVR
eukprot:6765575-Prymnesium_polylepis.1